MPANAAAVPQANKAPLATAKNKNGAAWGAAACVDGAKLMAIPWVRVWLTVTIKQPNKVADKRKDFIGGSAMG